LKNRVYDAAQYLLTTLAILKEGSIVLMNVPISQQLRKKLGFVDIVVNHLKPTHRPQIFVVLGSVELRGKILKYGRHGKRFFANVFNVGKSFGANLRTLRSLVVNFVQDVAVLMHTFYHRINTEEIISTVVLTGKIFVFKFLNVMDGNAKFVTLMAMDYMFTIKKLEEMVGWIQKKTSLLFVTIVIE
jgi:hypothetical protein